MSIQISALASTPNYIYAGTLSGQIYYWSVQQIKQLLSSSNQNDDVEMDEIFEATPTLTYSKKLDFSPTIGSINQIITREQNLILAHSKGLHQVSEEQVKQIIDCPVLQVMDTKSELIALSKHQISFIGTKQTKTYPLQQNATCFALLSPQTIAIGFENSFLRVYSIQPFLKMFEFDHKIPAAAVRGITIQNNYILTAITGVGVFKWLTLANTIAAADVNPENKQFQQASLVKIMPVTRGFQINSLIQHEQELFVGVSDSHLLKYDLTLGYQGFYESSKLSEIYSVHVCEKEIGQQSACLVAGKLRSKPFVSRPQYETETTNSEQEEICVELTQLKTNSLLIRLQ